MNNQFLYLDYYKKTIQDKDFIVINILEFHRKRVYKIYKLLDQKLIDKLLALEKFDNINDLIIPGIKRDDTISLDINFK